jgi:hypothetical protein
MPLLSRHNLFTKTLIITGLILIVYGYLAKIFDVYFFWESAFIGWMTGLVGLIGLLLTWIEQRRLLNKKSIIQKIGIGIISFIMLIQFILLIVLSRSDAYEAAKKYIRNNENIRKELGDIKGYAIIPFGSISVSSGNGGTVGVANLKIIVKGEKKFRQYEVGLVKEANSDWKLFDFH